MIITFNKWISIQMNSSNKLFYVNEPVGNLYKWKKWI